MSEVQSAARETTPQQAISPPVQPAQNSEVLKKRLKGMMPTSRELIVLLLLGNFVFTGALWYRFETTRQPEIATVGVTALTRLYATKVAADPNATPEILKAKTELFQDTVRKAVEDLALRKKVIIIAREAVLTGEHEDLTPELEAAVAKIAESDVKGASQPKGGLDGNLLGIQ